MLGLDTNVLVRFLVRDDAAQYERARKLIKGEVDRGQQVFVSLMILLELEWVLRSRHAFSKAEILEVMSHLLDAAEICFEDESTLEEALFLWDDCSADFADFACCMIGAKHRLQGCRATASFDAKAIKLPMFVAV
jgi:predicted nucleic-acid-binding protein